MENLSFVSIDIQLISGYTYILEASTSTTVREIKQ